MSNNLPDKLYHYCSLSAFMSIIQNKCFLLSDVMYTNDDLEMRVFDNTVNLVLRDLLRDNKINEEVQKFWISYKKPRVY